VASLRVLCGLPDRGLELDDLFVIVQSTLTVVALVVDSVVGVTSFDGHDVVPAGEVLPGPRSVEAVAKGAGGLVFLHDLDRLLELTPSGPEIISFLENALPGRESTLYDAAHT
jgi:chemotaxis signal transduction protein